MKLRKSFAGISAMLITAGALPFSQAAAFAADSAKEKTFTKGTIPAYVYSLDNKVDIECRFYEDMPNVPYIKISDYYKNYSGDALEIKGEKGKYTVTTPVGATATIDVNSDTLESAEYEAFFRPTAELSEDSGLVELFVNSTDVKTEGDPKPMTIDFAAYDIDIYGDDNEIWMPAPTICNIFTGDILDGVYCQDSIAFVNMVDPSFTRNSVLTMQKAQEYANNMIENGRPADLVKYNYFELCRTFDCEYGYPGRIPLNDIIAEKGLDKTLAETNTDTKLVRSHLLSTDYKEYLQGLVELEVYLWDGGHTTIATTGFGLLPNELTDPVVEAYFSHGGYQLASNFHEDNDMNNASAMGVIAARTALMGEETEPVLYRYIEEGGTAYFSFDSFMSCDLAGWTAYYKGEGERPADIVSAFYDCVVKADKNPAIKNFVVDISTNGGGLIPVEQYMMAIMADQKTSVNENVRLGVKTTTFYTADKNLDGKFDDADKDLKFDLNFGVLTSRCSFSSANILPSDARDSQILILGEKSGGGSCSVMNYMTADGMPITISSAKIRFANHKGENIDAGTEPDFNYVINSTDEKTGATVKDFSTAFDPYEVGRAFAKFYNQAVYRLGDPNNDTKIDSKDATFVLSAYAALATGDDITDVERMASDVNGDSKVDSRDASDILAYYSYRSTGGKDGIVTFLESEE